MQLGTHRNLFYFMVICTSLTVFVTSFLLPQNAWDLLGHVGSMYALGETDAAIIHQASYEAVLSAVGHDPMVVDDLLNGNENRTIWATDPEAFHQNLPFYAPRILVTGPMWVASWLGFSPVIFLQLYTSLAVAMGVAVFGLAFCRRLTLTGIICFPIVMLLGGALETARVEGADAITFFFFSLVVYGILNKKLWLVIPLVLMEFGRSDTIVLTVCFAPLLLWVFRERWFVILLGVALGVLAYVGVNSYFGNYGWSKAFYVAHVEYLAFPGDAIVEVSPALYLTSVFNEFAMTIYDKSFLLFGLCTTVLIAVFSPILKQNRENLKNGLESENADTLLICAIGLCSLIYVVLHFIAFPTIHVRYFSGQYTFQLLAVLTVLKTQPLK